MNRKALVARIVFAAVFFLLALRSPLTAWLVAGGLSREMIGYVSEVAGLAGLALLFLAGAHVR